MRGKICNIDIIISEIKQRQYVMRGSIDYEDGNIRNISYTFIANSSVEAVSHLKEYKKVLARKGYFEKPNRFVYTLRNSNSEIVESQE